MSPPPSIQLINLSKVYGVDSVAVTALDSINLDFSPGSFTAVMGPSGSGKSTLLHCAAGLERPTSGRVLLTGTDLASLKEPALTRLRRERLRVPVLQPDPSAHRRAERRAAAAAGRSPSETGRDLRGTGSGRTGQPGRASSQPAVRWPAAAGRHRPRADHPARGAVRRRAPGALDSTTSREVLTALRTLVEQTGLTTIMVTHDPLAASYAHRVIFLADCRLAGELASPTVETVAAWMTRLEEVSC